MAIKAGLWSFIGLLYLVFTGLLCVFAVQLYTGASVNLSIYGICAGLIFGIYTLNRYTDTMEDFTNDIGRFTFFHKRKFLFALGGLAIAASILALGFLGRLTYYHLVLVVLGLAYSFEIVPWYNHGLVYVRLKRIPFAKNLVVALGWGLSIFMIPAGFAGQAVALGPLCIGCIILVLNNTLFCDIRDIVGDRIAGNRTLPVLWGERPCLVLLVMVNLCWAIAIGVMTGRLGAGLTLFLLAMAVFPAAYIMPHAKRLSVNARTFLAESDLLLFAVGLIVVHITGEVI